MSESDEAEEADYWVFAGVVALCALAAVSILFAEGCSVPSTVPAFSESKPVSDLGYKYRPITTPSKPVCHVCEDGHCDSR